MRQSRVISDESDQLNLINCVTGELCVFARRVIRAHYIDSGLIGCVDACRRRHFHLVD